MLVSTSPLDEAGTATHFPLSESSGRKGPAITSSRAPTIQSRRGHQCGVSKGSALRLRLTGSVVQPRVSDDLLSYKAIGFNYLSFVVTSMLVSTSPLDEAGTATVWSPLTNLRFGGPPQSKIGLQLNLGHPQSQILNRTVKTFFFGLHLCDFWFWPPSNPKSWLRQCQ